MLNETWKLYQYYTNDIDTINKVKQWSDDLYSCNVYSYSFIESSEVEEFWDYYCFEVIKEKNIQRKEWIYWAVEDLIDWLDELIKNEKVLIVWEYTHEV
jgi:CRISPR/Cas system CMR-associated protein Cmr1 (group 7 of RAMP superfamily)